eukprot:523297_1
MPKGAFSKRVNASSGGLHPVECYFILPPNIINQKDNKWLFCHYPVRQHVLEILGAINVDDDEEEKDEKTNDDDDDDDEYNIFYILVSSVDFRETWKYGERG